jgi:hypothetical protein
MTGNVGTTSSISTLEAEKLRSCSTAPCFELSRVSEHGTTRQPRGRRDLVSA